MTNDGPIYRAWHDATNCWLAGAGLPPLKEPEEPEAEPEPEEIIETEQDEYARKRGFRNIDEYLDSKVNR